MVTRKHTVTAKLDDIPGTLPVATLPEGIDLASLADATIARLPNLTEDDLAENAIWRDMFALTGYMRTFHSPQTVLKALLETSQVRHSGGYKAVEQGQRLAKMGPNTEWVDIDFTFSTHGELDAIASGSISIIPDPRSNDGWKIWMLRTWLESFEGHGNPDHLEPRHFTANGAIGNTNGYHGHASGSTAVDYEVLIVGGSQAGLSVAGRLQALGVPYLLIERNSEIGQSYTDRYDSLRWHTSKENGNLPFDRTYLPEDDYMLTVKQIGSGFKRWAERFDIKYKTGTSLDQASWDEKSRSWSAKLTDLSSSRSTELRVSNLVLAVGGYASNPVTPDWPGMEAYKGTAIHSVEYKSSEPWAGKKGIVVGTANTAHDVAEDMANAGFQSVTMVQRGKTFVFPAEWLHTAEDMYYNLDTPIDQADRRSYTYPIKIMREFTNRRVHHLVDVEKGRFDALEKAGFKLERYGDIYDNLYNRFGGHYIDIGASSRIANGEIKMKSDSPVKEWTEKGLRFEDGTEIDADLVVLCTGFEHDFRKLAAKLVGQDAADSMDEFFGLNAEGEIRGAWRYAGHPNLIYAGGDVRQCRWFSRFIALQIQAQYLGKPLKPYMNTPA